MKKAVRLALLLAVTFLAAWSSAPKLAYAQPLCESLDTKPCAQPGKVQICLWGSGGGNGSCYCDPTLRKWECD